MVLSGEDARVEEDEADDEPKHPLGLAHPPGFALHAAVPSAEGMGIRFADDAICEKEVNRITDQATEKRIYSLARRY